ncbi:uncharacterized protein LOC142345552 [Convolutriloba macropyga]|uniref:uncharacterized protein LOC142345552 n=1 Tax=Convolutriloba macropyga TaxID=536237 RepID=UPI003F51C4AA
MVTPHLILQDFFLNGELPTFSTLLDTEHRIKLFKENNEQRPGYATFDKHWLYDDIYNSWKPHSVSATLFQIERPLRCLKMSFGFVNSILLIVLIKPLHEPIVGRVKFLREKLSSLLNKK